MLSASPCIDTETSDTLYTSVHYVIESNSRTRITCEVQVRTLSEEVWGEVDHKINYPHPYIESTVSRANCSSSQSHIKRNAIG